VLYNFIYLLVIRRYF